MASPELFPVLDLRLVAVPARILEPLGSKPKFWFQVQGDVDHVGLFKFARQGTGEDWAERLAAGLADLLSLPHATYDLAHYIVEQETGEDNRLRGVISWQFLRHERGVPQESLIIGNEILAGVVSGYPRAEQFGRYRRTQQHTVDVVLQQCRQVSVPPRWSPPEGIENGSHVVVGYLLLDAWIGNTDRHDENWGWIRDASGLLYLAPTFDHASSLGRNEADDRMRARLSTKDQRFSVGAYASKAASGFHDSSDGKPMLAFDAFRRAVELEPGAAQIWLGRLGEVTEPHVAQLLDRVPGATMSPVAREFVARILVVNRARLLALKS